MIGAGPERRKRFTHPEFQNAQSSLASVFIGMPNPRDRYARLLSVGVPLSIVSRIDSEGLPGFAAINTIRTLEDYTDFNIVQSVVHAVAENGRIEFPVLPEPSVDTLPEPFRRRFHLAQMLVPHFLCASAERVTLLRDRIGIPESILENIRISGKPFLAALETVSVVSRFDSAELLEQQLQRQQNER